MTMKLTDLQIQNGEVVFLQGQEARPATSETKGNVTINNAAVPGTPDRFEVTFALTNSFDDGGIQVSSLIRLNTVVLGKGKESPYSVVEAEGARKIAPMLREMADAVERLVAKYDASESNENRT